MSKNKPRPTQTIRVYADEMGKLEAFRVKYGFRTTAQTVSRLLADAKKK